MRGGVGGGIGEAAGRQLGAQGGLQPPRGPTGVRTVELATQKGPTRKPHLWMYNPQAKGGQAREAARNSSPVTGCRVREEDALV